MNGDSRPPLDFLIIGPPAHGGSSQPFRAFHCNFSHTPPKFTPPRDLVRIVDESTLPVQSALLLRQVSSKNRRALAGRGRFLNVINMRRFTKRPRRACCESASASSSDPFDAGCSGCYEDFEKSGSLFWCCCKALLLSCADLGFGATSGQPGRISYHESDRVIYGLLMIRIRTESGPGTNQDPGPISL